MRVRVFVFTINEVSFHGTLVSFLHFCPGNRDANVCSVPGQLRPWPSRNRRLDTEARAPSRRPILRCRRPFKRCWALRTTCNAATKLLETAARKYPELPSAHVLLYQILAQVNQPAAARFQLEVAINTEPHDPEPYIILGNIALQERRIYEGSRDYDKAREMLKGYTIKERKGAMEAQTLSGIAQVAESKEDWKEAEARLQGPAEGHARRSEPGRPPAPGPGPILADSRQGRLRDLEGGQEARHGECRQEPYAGGLPHARGHHGPVLRSVRETQDRECREVVQIRLGARPNDLPTRQVVAVWALENGKIPFAKEQAEAALRIEAADAS